MLEQSEDEVRTWRIGLREEGSAGGTVPNVQDTEQAEMILEMSTNTRHAEEVVDLVASSPSQCAEWSEDWPFRAASNLALLSFHKCLWACPYACSGPGLKCLFNSA